MPVDTRVVDGVVRFARHVCHGIYVAGWEKTIQMMKVGSSRRVATESGPPLPSFQLRIVPEILRAVIVRYMVLVRKVPLLIFRNVHADVHYPVLQHYASIVDIIVLREQEAVQPYLHMPGRPEGLIDYQRFGIAKRSSHAHLSVKRHEWIAWILAMHILTSLERVYYHNSLQQARESMRHGPKEYHNFSAMMPPPLYLETTDTRPWKDLIPTESASPFVQCFCSYELAVRTRNMTVVKTEKRSNLADVIVRQVYGSEKDLLLPKQHLYNSGWVLDLDDATKRSKLLTKDSEFYGFPDWKPAYYGIPSSGALELLVPLPHQLSSNLPTTLILCESDIPKLEDDDSSCSLRRDVAITIDGGQPVQGESMDSILELSRCIYVPISRDATTTALAARTQGAANNELRAKLSVTVRVTNPQVTLKKGPCSIAHVIVAQTKL